MCGWCNQALRFVGAVVDGDSQILRGRVGGSERIGVPLAGHFLDGRLDYWQSFSTNVADGVVVVETDLILDNDMSKFGGWNMRPEELAKKIARLKPSNDWVGGKIKEI